MVGQPRTGVQADNQWCMKPAPQSGQDIAPQPKLSPALFAEHAKQTVLSFDVPRFRAN
jgi:hypothetical protein